MKKIIILIILIVFSLVISLWLFFNIPEFHNEENIVWKKKENEIKTRLLAIPILLYHNIDGKGAFSMDLPVIRSHFQLFKNKKIRVIKLSELINRLDKPVPFDDRVIVITFDDGFNSMYTKLLPLVKEFQYPVTLFIYSDLFMKMKKTGLNWEKLRYLDKNGIDIQAHSKSHADLVHLSGENTPGSRGNLFREIYLSKKAMEIYLGKEILFFAFPYGKYDLNIVELASVAGYKRVFSTDYGSNIITRNNYSLRRQHIKRNYTLNELEKLIQ